MEKRKLGIKMVVGILIIGLLIGTYLVKGTYSKGFVSLSKNMIDFYDPKSVSEFNECYYQNFMYTKIDTNYYRP